MKKGWTGGGRKSSIVHNLSKIFSSKNTLTVLVIAEKG